MYIVFVNFQDDYSAPDQNDNVVPYESTYGYSEPPFNNYSAQYQSPPPPPPVPAAYNFPVVVATPNSDYKVQPQHQVTLDAFT